MGHKLIVLLFSLCSVVIQTNPKQKQQKEKVQEKKTDKPKVTDAKEPS